MSALVSLSSCFYASCSYVASGISAVKDGAQYLARTNYNIVESVLSFFTFIFDSFRILVGTISYYISAFVTSVLDCVHAVSLFMDGVLEACLNVVSSIRGSVLDGADIATSVANSVVCTISDTVFSMKMLTVDVFDTILCFVSSVATFVTGTGQLCVGLVTSLWRGLGFVLASIAYFPVYVFECIESLKTKMIENIVHAFTTVPKETYLGIICLCLVYFTLSNAVRYLSSHGLKMFSLRVRSRRPRPSFDWQFDRDFESDFEDLYGNDQETNIWMMPGVTVADNRGRVNGDLEDASDDSSTSGSGTADRNNDLSDNDEDDDDDEEEDDEEEDTEDEESDGITAISDDSDSDTSLNSQTVSIGSSDHDIEISLPAMEGYSLRSRSSTPSSVGGRVLSSPEEFNREMELEKDKRKCVVCQDQIKSVLVLPCRHMCLCVLCANQIVRSRTAARRVCPLCRARIEKVMNVYV